MSSPVSSPKNNRGRSRGRVRRRPTRASSAPQRATGSALSQQMPHSDLASSHGALAAHPPIEQGLQAGGGGQNSVNATLALILAKLDALNWRIDEMEAKFDKRMRGMAILLGDLKENLDRINIPQALERFYNYQITVSVFQRRILKESKVLTKMTEELERCHFDEATALLPTAGELSTRPEALEVDSCGYYGLETQGCAQVVNSPRLKRAPFSGLPLGNVVIAETTTQYFSTKAQWLAFSATQNSSAGPLSEEQQKGALNLLHKLCQLQRILTYMKYHYDSEETVGLVVLAWRNYEPNDSPHALRQAIRDWRNHLPAVYKALQENKILLFDGYTCHQVGRGKRARPLLSNPPNEQ
ncbi:hypothetical protein QOT17_008765 [Balamuthia mandrillaris]